MKKLLLLITLALAITSGLAYAQIVKPQYISTDNTPLFIRNDAKDIAPVIDEVPPYLMRTKFDPRWSKEDFKGLTPKVQAAEGVELINISEIQPLGQHETWMAINPTNPNNLIATSNCNVALSSGNQGWVMYAYYTVDGGRTWKRSVTPPGNDIFFKVKSGGTIFDPGVTFDHEGNAFYLYGLTETNNDGDENNGVMIAKSDDNGATWNAFEKVETDFPAVNAIKYESGTGAKPFNDRWTITTDISDESPFKGSMYVSWQRFGQSSNGQPIAVSRSEDGGVSWSDITELRPFKSHQAPTPAVGPDGTVYVAWHERGGAFTKLVDAVVQRSTDGGYTYSGGDFFKAQTLINTGEQNEENGRFTLQDKMNIRVSSYVQIVADISNTGHRGNVYLVQSGRISEQGPDGVFMARSTDKGETWTNMIKVDDNDKVGRDVFFPSIACDPVTGQLAVMYYSSKDADNNAGVDAYVAISKDAGETWKNIRLTGKSIYIDSDRDVFNQGSNFNIYWGDYTHIVSRDNNVYPLFWFPTQENNFQSNDLFTAIISENPRSVINLLAENKCESSPSIYLSWENPTTNLMNEELGEFEVEIYRNNNLLTELPGTGPSEYLDTDIEDGVDYNYSLRVVELANQNYSKSEEVFMTACGSRQAMPPVITAWENTADGFKVSWNNPSKAIDDTELKGLQAIEIYVNDMGTPAKTLSNEPSGGVINPGESMETSLNGLETDKFNYVVLKAVTDRGGQETKSDFSMYEKIYSGESLSNFKYDLDTEEQRMDWYQEHPQSQGTWDIVDLKGDGNYYFADSPGGTYKPATYSRLYIAPIKPIDGATTFNFDHIASLQRSTSTADYGEISFSTDFGKTWNVLKWVDEASSEGFKSSFEDSEWDNLTFDFSDYMNQTVLVRFTLTSNNIIQYDGWFIDNIALDDAILSAETEVFSEHIAASIYPNPAQNSATLTYSNVHEGNAELEITDIFGKSVLKTSLGYVTDGISSVALDLRSFNNGVYFCNVRIGNTAKMIKLVVNK